MTRLTVHVEPALSDNYIYVLHDSATGVRLLVDPGEAAAARRAVTNAGLAGLDYVLVTHRHGDHIGGLTEIQKAYAPTVVATRHEATKIGHIDRPVAEGDTLDLDGLSVEVIDTPGHTRGHVCFYLPDGPVLFAGDTLFVMGCGRLFEGKPEEMWASMQKLRRLPGDTALYCGHEYTATNARFTADIDGDNPDIQARVREVKSLRDGSQPTVPSTLAQEGRTNLFLRADEPALKHTMGMARAGDVEVFAQLRQRRNGY